MTELDFDELDKAVSNLMKEATRPRDEPAVTPAAPQQSTLSELDTVDNSNGAADDTASVSVAVKPEPEPKQVSESESKLELISESAPEPSEASSEGETSVDATLDEADQSSRPATSSLAMKRRGRFMDVVHPSSDMRPNAMPKRTGATLQPLASVEQPEVSSAQEAPTHDDDAAVVVPSVEANQGIETTAEADVSVHDMSHLDAPKSEYPDPITLQMDKEATGVDSESDAKSESAVVSPEEPTVVPEDSDESVSSVAEASDVNMPVEGVGMVMPDEVEPSTANVDAEAAAGAHIEADDVAEDAPAEDQSQPVEERPLTSPFLPNAKVEKRPLGGNGLDEQLATATVGDALQAADAATIARQKGEAAIPLPAELSGAVMVVESADVGHPEAKESQPEATAPTSQQEQSGVSGSIPQQYKEQSSSAEPESGAIYDTKTYHQPLEHPAKKKSGIGVVIWILALLTLGALAGAAYFYFQMR